MKNLRFVGVLTILLLVGLLSYAQASESDQQEHKALELAKVSLTQAIDIAQQQGHGQALSAELDDEQQPPVYLVEVDHQGETLEVTLDPQTGKVLHSRRDGEDDDTSADKDRD